MWLLSCDLRWLCSCSYHHIHIPANGNREGHNLEIGKLHYSCPLGYNLFTWPQPGAGDLGEWLLFWGDMCKLKSRGSSSPGKDVCWGLQRSRLFPVLCRQSPTFRTSRAMACGPPVGDRCSVPLLCALIVSALTSRRLLLKYGRLLWL